MKYLKLCNYVLEPKSEVPIPDNTTLLHVIDTFRPGVNPDDHRVFVDLICIVDRKEVKCGNIS